MNDAGQSQLPTLDVLTQFETIRLRSRFIYQKVGEGLGLFKIQEEKWPQVVEWVDLTMLERYPDDTFPIHSRWRHFEIGNINRAKEILDKLSSEDSLTRIKSQWDLAMVSVLLDAGAGHAWSYLDEANGEVYSRSEGLAIATFDMFKQGIFSSNPSQPFQVDSVALKNLSMETFEKKMQITASNPMIGTKERFELLKSLGNLLEKNPIFKGENGFSSPGNLINKWKNTWNTTGIDIQDLFSSVLLGLSPLWPTQNIVVEGHNLFDCWRHPLLPQEAPYCGIIPFHKLTLWLTYSLIEPVLNEPKGNILNWTTLPGLPEYRNGGLFVDMKLIIPKDVTAYDKEYNVSDPFIIEWRALTIVLLDILAQKMQKFRDVSPSVLPLPAVLEGGSWSAGRKLAKQLRSSASPPFKIKLTGTVF